VRRKFTLPASLAIALALATLAAGCGNGTTGAARTITATHATPKNWAVVIPFQAWAAGIGSALAIGAVAGLMPAIRASRMPPTVALRTV
jgi:putative ABC transport system permease protein